MVKIDAKPQFIFHQVHFVHEWDTVEDLGVLILAVSSKGPALGYTVPHAGTVLQPKSSRTSRLLWTVHAVQQTVYPWLVTVNRRGALWSHTRAQVTQVKGQGRDGIFIISVNVKGKDFCFFCLLKLCTPCSADFERKQQIWKKKKWKTYHKY